MHKLTVEILKGIKCILQGFFLHKPLLTIILLSVFPFGGILVEAKRGCRIYSSAGVQVADCSLQEMPINVPEDLIPNIGVLNLSGNHLTNINEKSFERFKDTLLSLDLSNMTHYRDRNITYDENSFYPLEKLEYLDISGSCISNVKHRFRFPNNIKILKMERCDMLHPNFSNIHVLEELHAARCNMSEFPAFNRLAPLKYLDLRHNSLAKFQIEALAPFCLLRRLRLEMNEGEGLQHIKGYCQCMAIDSWLTSTGIEHDRLNCSRKEKKTTTTPNCTPTPSEHALQLRRECLSRVTTGSVTSIKTNWWLIGIAVVVLMALIIPSFIYSRRKFGRRRRGDDDENEEHDEAGDDDDYDDDYEEGYEEE